MENGNVVLLENMFDSIFPNMRSESYKRTHNPSLTQIAAAQSKNYLEIEQKLYQQKN